MSEDKWSPSDRRRTSEQVDEQAERVWQLRLRGKQHREIARIENISIGRVTQLLDRIREQIPPRNVDHLVEEAAARYERMRDIYQDKADNGDKEAARLLLSIETEMRKLLGLDQPTRVESSGELVHRVIGVSDEDI